LLSDSSSRDRVVSEPGLLASRADALVLLDLVPTTFEPDSRFPVVVVGDHSDAFDSVSIDNVHGGRIAGEHLVGLGHSRVGLIAGAEEDKFTAVTMLRTRGLEEALAGVGVSLEENAVVFGHYSGLGGYEAMNELLARPNPPTAVFALSDDMALGAIRAATEAGMSIPHDVSIVGFDDHELSFVLGLTTVAQDPAGLGAAGAQMLLDRLEGHSGAPREAHGEVRLIERSSTARI
ncbi:MAG: substrate-binding domain-containing protein, partial [Acidimicrobiia bacterium]|nr:substrate-binding domain-containing protein [Acidimicrobiia bacterium]